MFLYARVDAVPPFHMFKASRPVTAYDINHIHRLCTTGCLQEALDFCIHYGIWEEDFHLAYLVGGKATELVANN